MGSKIISKSKENASKAEESMHTKARKFIQNEFSNARKTDVFEKTQQLLTLAQNRNAREKSEELRGRDYSDTSFCTDGADSSHHEKYIIGKRIGQGAYALVRAGINSNTNK
jgi:hypothetical protein